MASILTQANQDMLKICMKLLSGVKPDFAIIATELGCTPNQAYHRHYRMLKRLPELGIGAYNTAVTPSSSSVGAAVPKTPSKRRGAGKLKATKSDENDDDVGNGSPTKKARTATTKRTGKGKGKANLKVDDESDDEDQTIVKLDDSDVGSGDGEGDDTATAEGDDDSGEDVVE